MIQSYQVGQVVNLVYGEPRPIVRIVEIRNSEKRGDMHRLEVIEPKDGKLGLEFYHAGELVPMTE